MLNSIIDHLKEIISVIVPFSIWALNTHFGRRPALYVSVLHDFTFLVDEPVLDDNGRVLRERQTLHTQSIMIRNGGRESAQHLELVFNYKPNCYNVWPVRAFTEALGQSDRMVLKFESLAPGESFTIEVMSINVEVPGLLTVRSDECQGKKVNMLPQIVQPIWKIRAAVGLMVVGLAATIYMTLIILQFVILKTPLHH